MSTWFLDSELLTCLTLNWIYSYYSALVNFLTVVESCFKPELLL